MTDGQPGTGPASARWTHVALPVRDLDASIRWWTRWTPLVAIHGRSDADGRTSWLGHDDQPDHPFVLVLIEKAAGFDAVATTLTPLAHIGIELPERADVDRIASQARPLGFLKWEAEDHGPPVGYICALSDPDGNIVEFSHDQGVYSAAKSAGRRSGND